ncbi:MAG: uroporphyrinogen-III C-methyltransferase [Arenimonas sp.]
MIDDSETTTEASGPILRRPSLWIFILLLVAALVALGLWQPWSMPEKPVDALDLSPEALDARLLSTEQQLQRAQRLQQSLEKKLADAQSRTGLLRDEVLGVNQRAAILEENVREMAKEQNSSRQSVQMEALELLLILADARINVDGDLPGALRAMRLANEVASDIRDSQMINVRQSLLQEMQMLSSATDRKPIAAGELDALEATLPQLAARLPGQTDAASKIGRNGFQRLLDAMVQVRSADEQSLLGANDRSAAEAALSLELALARSALNKRDNNNFQASIRRIDSWLKRLYADGPVLRERRAKLSALAKQDIRLNLPTAGSSLQLLRSMSAQRIQNP